MSSSNNIYSITVRTWLRHGVQIEYKKTQRLLFIDMTVRNNWIWLIYEHWQINIHVLQYSQLKHVITEINRIPVESAFQRKSDRFKSGSYNRAVLLHFYHESHFFYVYGMIREVKIIWFCGLAIAAKSNSCIWIFFCSQYVGIAVDR